MTHIYSNILQHLNCHPCTNHHSHFSATDMPAYINSNKACAEAPQFLAQSRLAAGVVRRLSENGGLSPADSLGTAASGTLDGMSDVDRKQRELYTRQQQLLREQRTADQEKLLSTISGLQAYHSLKVFSWPAGGSLKLCCPRVPFSHKQALN